MKSNLDLERDAKRAKTGSDTITQGIRIQADAQYMPADSDPEAHQYLYAYRVVITNCSTHSVCLKSRHWIIIDADHHREDIHGEGVVGKTPMLAPGESFAYTSGSPLRTQWGTMEGDYLMEREDGTPFQVKIARFYLTPNAPRLSTLKR